MKTSVNTLSAYVSLKEIGITPTSGPLWPPSTLSVPLLSQHGGNAGFGFQQDNARPSLACLTHRYLQQGTAKVMQCTASRVPRHELHRAFCGRFWVVWCTNTVLGRPPNQLQLLAVLQQARKAIPVYPGSGDAHAEETSGMSYERLSWLSLIHI